MEPFVITEDLVAKFQSGAINNEDIIAVFNPANAATIPESILQLMPHLLFEQIGLLATAYPNRPTGNSYLVLKDNNFKGPQAYPRSTWQNLFNLRKIGGTTSAGMVALSFTSRFNLLTPATKIKTAPVQDISKTEGLPGITTGAVQKLSEVNNEIAPEADAAGDGLQIGTLGGQTQAGEVEAGKGAANGTEGDAQDFQELTIEDIQHDQAKANTISALTEDEANTDLPTSLQQVLAASKTPVTNPATATVQEPQETKTTTGRTVKRGKAAAKKAAAKKANS